MDWFYAHDEAALFYFGSLQRPWLLHLMKGFTFLGEKYTLSVLALVLAGLFLWGRRPRTAAILVVSSALALATSTSIKFFIHRTRPDMAWRAPEVRLPTTPSFPSGHSFLSLAVFGGAAMLAARGLRRRGARLPLIAAGVGLSVCIGLSRIYLGVHYPVDVLTGWSGGLAYALLATYADQRWGYQPPDALLANGPPGYLPVSEEAEDALVAANRDERAQSVSPRSKP